MKPRISIIIPVKDEQANLPILIAELELTIAALQESYQFHVLILDDGSVDATVDIVKSSHPKNFSLGLCSFTRNFGKEAAIAAGLEKCESDAYIVMDADLQHPPELIPQMLEHWETGHLVVEAVKQHRGSESLAYNLFSRFFYYWMSSMGDLKLEGASDFKLLDREVVNEFRRLPEKARFFRGLVSWMSFDSKQVLFDVPQRKTGASSWSTVQLIQYSINATSSFTSAPLQLVTMIGVVMLGISVLLGSITLIQWISGQAVTGFTTVIILLLMIGSMLMVSLGIIGLYISRIYDEIKARPAYTVSEEFDLSPPATAKE